MNDHDECLNRNMNHDYYFAGAQDGLEHFTCKLCGYVMQQYADSQP